MSTIGMDNFIKIKFSISIYIDNYHDEFEMYYLFKKFKGRFLLLSESCRKPTVSCGFINYSLWSKKKKKNST